LSDGEEGERTDHKVICEGKFSSHRPWRLAPKKDKALKDQEIERLLLR